MIQIDPSLQSVSGVQAISALVQMDVKPGETFPNLPVGLSASVDVISARARNAVIVPIEALRQLDTNEYAVFVMKNGELTLIPVQVGLTDQISAEITSGLNPGDVVSTGITKTQ